MSEADFTTRLTKDLVADGAIVFPIVGGMMQGGWPDRAVWHRSWHGLIELKGERTPLSQRQHFNLGLLWKRRPGSVWIAREPGILQHPVTLDEVARFTSGTEMIDAILKWLEQL